MANLKVATWNMHGLYSNLKKLNDQDFLASIESYDIVILLETWHAENSDINVQGFDSFSKPIRKSKSKGRHRGGIIILYKTHLRKNIENLDSEQEGSLWLKLNKTYLGLHMDLYLCGTYRRPINNNQYSEEYFETLENEIAKYSNLGITIITGDFNARTGVQQDFILESDLSNRYLPVENYRTDSPLPRKNLDKCCNREGQLLLNLCKNSQLRILNGRSLSDSMGYHTYYHMNGCSTVDYTLCPTEFLSEIKYFAISSPSHLSDHSMQHFMITTKIDKQPKPQFTKLTPNYGMFKWQETDKQHYRSILGSPSIQAKISELMSSNDDSDALLKETENIMVNAAKGSATFKPRNRKKTRKKTTQNKWFDSELSGKRRLLRSQQRALRKDPNNPNARRQFIITGKQYRQMIKHKQRKHKDEILNRLINLESSNPKLFWETLDTLRNKKNSHSEDVANIPADKIR